MPLNDREIVHYRAKGLIVIEPFRKSSLGSDTYDVRLGEWFFREQSPLDGGVYNILDERHVHRVWGSPEPAIRAPKSLGWRRGSRVIWIYPGETLLAHTVEFIGARRGFTTKMFSRSSIGRSLLGVCKCAGRGDVGYFNRWTMEITSFSRFHRIPLRVGMRIGQIEFLPVTETVSRIYGKTHGKYQSSDDLDNVISSWAPEMMLPKLWMDKS